MKMTPVTMSILLLPFCSAMASAQTDPTVMMKQAAANQLGLLEYCQAQGALDDKPVTAQRAIMAQIPASQTAVPTDQAEALGKQGSLSINGTTMTLASAAATHNTTIDAMCKQIGGAVVQASAMLQQQQQQQGGAMTMQGVPGGMPSAPSGMPTMPAMPAMPSVPGGMPTMPGAPPAR